MLYPRQELLTRIILALEAETDRQDVGLDDLTLVLTDIGERVTGTDRHRDYRWQELTDKAYAGSGLEQDLRDLCSSSYLQQTDPHRYAVTHFGYLMCAPIEISEPYRSAAEQLLSTRPDRFPRALQ